MKKYLVSINDLPPEGKEFELEDQEIWKEPLKEFKMDCQITSPLKIKLFVMPADAGCLVRGHLEGEVVVPCNRCAENATVKIDSRFDEYEEVPEDDGHARHRDGKSGDSHIVFDRNAPMLDLAEVAWEQFMLAMPVTPLCRSDCKGLCPTCGANLNLGPCACQVEDGDPRMAALRNVKIDKQ